MSPDNEFLVSFCVAPSVEARSSARLRVQSCDRARIDRVESFLARNLQKRVEIVSRQIANRFSIEFESEVEAITALFALDSSDIPTEIESDVILGELRESMRRAFERWSSDSHVLDLPRDRTWHLGRRVQILGILNATPDSFSDGVLYDTKQAAVRHALQMLEDGADAIDVGGESTRPGSRPVPADEEIRRVGPVIAAIRQHSDVPISVDTSKASVARVALDEGADIVNDVTALEGDSDMVALLRDRPVPVVLMHMRGTPRTMQDAPHYDDATAEILAYLDLRLRQLEAQGISRERLVVDPGFGFGKRSVDNLGLLKNVNEFKSLGRPVLVGLSRKSFLGKVLGKSVEEREAGTLVANTLATLAGASIVRSHHVSNAREMARLLEPILRSEKPGQVS